VPKPRPGGARSGSGGGAQGSPERCRGHAGEERPVRHRVRDRGRVVAGRCRRQAVPAHAGSSWRVLRRPHRPSPGPGAAAIELTHLARCITTTSWMRRTQAGAAFRQRAMGQQRGHPDRRLPVRAGLGHLGRAGDGRLQAAGPDDRLTVRRGHPRGGSLGAHDAERGCLPGDDPPQDRRAHRHVLPSRRNAVGVHGRHDRAS